MIFNERKYWTLLYFSKREWVRPGTFAIDERIYPIRSAWSYLKHLHKWNYLNRGFDATGHVVYRLSRVGARWLLNHREGV